MEPKILIKASYFKLLKDCEKKWTEHCRKPTAEGEQIREGVQIGQGNVALSSPVIHLKLSKDNRFNSFIQRLKSRVQPLARKLLSELNRFPHVVNWMDDGTLIFKNVLSNANLHEVLPLVFYGSRKKFTAGTT